MDSQDNAVGQPAPDDSADVSAPDVPASDVPAPDVSAPEAKPRGWLPVVAVGVAAAVCVALAAVFFVQRDSAASENQSGAAPNTAFVAGSDTDGVTAAAREILAAIYTYGYNDIDGLAARIRPLMTDDMYAQYQTTSPPSAEMIKQAKTQVTAVLGDSSVGIASVSGDTAVAEALLGVEGTNDGVAISKAQVPVRLTLQRVDGKWIASDIQPI